MNRYILGEMEKIFDTLKAHVDDDDKGRILNGRITIGSATAEEKGPQEGSNLVE